MAQAEAQFAGNGDFPCQELQCVSGDKVAKIRTLALSNFR